MKHGCFASQYTVISLRLFVGVALAISMRGSIVQAGEIRIWPTASVQGKAVLLGDVAELVGFNADISKTLSDTVVYAAPRAGGETAVSVADIRGALTEAGANLAEIQMMGAARCRVTRPAQTKLPPQPRSAQPTKPKYVKKTPRVIPSLDSKPVTGDTLESLLREYISARLADQPGKIDIRFSPVNQRDMALTRAEYHFNIHPKDPAKLGLVTFDVKISNPDEDERVVPILAEVSLLREVVIAKREINRGQPIEGRDLSVEERRFTDASALGMQDLNLVVGQRAREFVRGGEMINEKLIEPRPIIRRGEPVTIWMRQGSLVIKTAGRAQQAGSLGDKIEVRRDGTKRKQDLFEAIVTGPGTVTVGDSTRLASR
jgi:flagella basal body P-ring formation protein FlgA